MGHQKRCSIKATNSFSRPLHFPITRTIRQANSKYMTMTYKEDSLITPFQLVVALLPIYTDTYANGTAIILSTGQVIHRDQPLKQVLEDMARLYGKTIQAIRHSSPRGKRATSSPLTLDPLHTFVPLHVRTPVGRDGAYGFFNAHVILPHQVKARPDGQCDINIPKADTTCTINKNINFVLAKLSEGEQQHAAKMFELYRAFQHPCNQRFVGLWVLDLYLHNK